MITRKIRHVATRRVSNNVNQRRLVSAPECITTFSYDGNWCLPTFIHSPPPFRSTNNDDYNNEEDDIRPPLLLIQGWGGAGEDWGSFPRMLAARCNRHVITYDARFIGNSYRTDRVSRPISPSCHEGDARNLTIEDMAFDAMAVAESAISRISGPYIEKGQKLQISVAGVSMGGMVASQMAAGVLKCISFSDWKSNIVPALELESIIVLSSSPSVPHIKSEGQRMFLEAFDLWTDGDIDGHNRECAEKFFDALGEQFLTLPGRRKLHQKLINQFLKSRLSYNQGGAGIRAQLAAIKLFNAGYFLTDVGNTTSSLVIHGESDRVFPSIYARNMHRSLNRTGMSSLVVLPNGADHHCWISHTQDIVQEIGLFYNYI